MHGHSCWPAICSQCILHAWMDEKKKKVEPASLFYLHKTGMCAKLCLMFESLLDVIWKSAAPWHLLELICCNILAVLYLYLTNSHVLSATIKRKGRTLTRTFSPGREALNPLWRKPHHEWSQTHILSHVWMALPFQIALILLAKTFPPRCLLWGKQSITYK